MRQKTGSVDLSALLALANGKNNSYFLPSTTPPASPAEGDQWFKTDKGNELHRFTNGAWEKVDLTSAVFSNVTAGGATIGFLNSLLVYADQDNYWNMSGADLDSDLEPTSTPGDIAFAANTLKTSHLVALEDVHVDGGPGSYLKIPTENDEQSYVELDNGGMNIVSRMVDTGQSEEFEINTTFPSSTENDGIICHSEMETTRSASPADPTTWEDYETNHAVGGLYFGYSKGTGGGDNKVTTKTNSAAISHEEIEMREDGHTYFWAKPSGLTIGSIINPMPLYVNNTDISGIANGYPTQAGHDGACTVWTQAGCRYISFALDTTNKILYVYGSNNPASLPYIGKVQLT